MPDGDPERGGRAVPMRLSAGLVPEALGPGCTTGRPDAGGAGS
jgi:hypothetical protein